MGRGDTGRWAFNSNTRAAAVGIESGYYALYKSARGAISRAMAM